jgi:hypothetical protein
MTDAVGARSGHPSQINQHHGKPGWRSSNVGRGPPAVVLATWVMHTILTVRSPGNSET